MGIPNHDSDEIPLDNIKADTNTSMEFSCFFTHNMGLKPILVLNKPDALFNMFWCNKIA